MRIQWEESCKLGNEPLPRTWPCLTKSILRLPASKTVRNKCLLFQRPNLWYSDLVPFLFQQFEETKIAYFPLNFPLFLLFFLSEHELILLFFPLFFPFTPKTFENIFYEFNHIWYYCNTHWIGFFSRRLISDILQCNLMLPVFLLPLFKRGFWPQILALECNVFTNTGVTGIVLACRGMFP